MSSIDKLAIRGIRSFDHNELAVIQFFHPLTVIVGVNGSGKTTIIECLKYMTSGEMPPNTKGGAFIHDPNIAGENEVKAEVKLRFKNIEGRKMNVARRLQVTRKKTATGLTMKTLEGTISYVDEEDKKGKRATISTKCAEMDEEVPLQLGVSKAILQNVIFCHQEDSNWPLSEPAGLKKKFDDIFEATRYTKALDNLKAIRKDSVADLKADKERLLALKSDRDRSRKLQKQINTLEENVVAKEGEHEDQANELQRVTDANVKFYENAAKYTQILQTRDKLADEIRLREENIQSIRETIDELKDSDTELQAKKDSFHEMTQTQARRQQERENEYQGNLSRITELRDMLSKRVSERGAAQAEANRHEQVKKDRQLLIEELAGIHNMIGYESQAVMDEGSVEEFLQRLEGFRRKQEDELDAIKKEGKRAQEGLQNQLQTLKAKEAEARGNRNSLQANADQIKNRIQHFTNRLDSSKTSATDVTFAEQRLNDANDRLKRAQAQQSEANHDAQIRTHNTEVKELDEKRDELQAELATLNKQADTRARLAIKRGESDTKKEAIATELHANRAKFEQLCGRNLSDETYERDVNEALKQRETELRGAERAFNSANRDLQAVDNELAVASKQLAERESELKNYLDTIRNGCDSGDLSTELKDAETELAAAQEEYSSLSTIANVFAKILKVGQERQVCHACNRGLSKKEMAAFETYVQQRIQENPTKVREAKEGIEGWQAELERLKTLVPTQTAAKRLEERDLPNWRETKQKAEDRQGPAKASAEQAQGKVENLKSDISALQQLKRSAIDVARMLKEVSTLNNDVTRLEQDLAYTGSTKTVDDVQKEMEYLTDSIARLKKEVSKLSSDKESNRAHIQKAESGVHEAKSALQTSRHELKERTDLESQIEDLKKEQARLVDQVFQLDQNRTDAEASRKVATELKRVQEDYLRKIDEASKSSAAYAKSIDRLNTSSAEVNRYERSGGPGRLSRAQADVKDFEAQLKTAEQTAHQTKNAIAAIEKEASQSVQIERNINDNIRLRQLMRDLRKSNEKLANLDVDEAERSARKYSEDYAGRRQQQEALQTAVAKLSGELGSIQSQLEEKKKELAEEYKDANAEYYKQLIHVKTAEFANMDLEKYAKALDRAIMDFHGVKMREINDTIDVLWRKVYQGSDVDKIMIKADSEGAKGGRSYNYRVVMYKDQVEMDMRGRCSAGQKVLASIIIRLALAESFGTNCGILALDEPTTNLDLDNISALAEALADIIKERRAQANFQLVVITHDEAFLNKLGESGACEKYWRVIRDQNQKSKIEKQHLGN